MLLVSPPLKKLALSDGSRPDLQSQSVIITVLTKESLRYFYILFYNIKYISKHPTCTFQSVYVSLNGQC